VTVPVARFLAAEPMKRRRFGALKDGVDFDETFFDPLGASELATWGDS